MSNERQLIARDALIEMIIGALVATSVSIVVIGVLKSSIKPSDSLSFIGAATGAGLAVLSAIWVERWKRDEVDRRQEAVLTDLLLEFRELICQAVYYEEPTRDPPEDFDEKMNLRARFIEELAALAETLETQLRIFAPANGQSIRTAVRLRREIHRHQYLREPESFKKQNHLNSLQFIPRFYEYARIMGPTLLDYTDDFIGALHSYGKIKVDLSVFHREPNPPIEIM